MRRMGLLRRDGAGLRLDVGWLASLRLEDGIVSQAFALAFLAVSA